MTRNEEFWFIGPKSATTDTWVSFVREEDRYGDAVTDAVRSGAARTEPVALRVENRGRHVGDLLWPTGAFTVVASQRFIDTLVELRATGWQAVPATVTYPNGEELAGYHLLVVTGTCDPFATDTNEDEDTEHPVDASQGWDGSDLFWEGTGHLSWRFVATERVRLALIDGNLERLQIERPYR